MAASIHIYSLWWLPVLFLAILPIPSTSASSVSHALQAETSFILHPKRHHGHQYTLHRRRRQATSGSGELEPAVIELLHISSNISARFGITEMNSVMINGNDEDLEVKFQVQLPIEAFISNFTMTIDDVVYIGKVLEKEEAQQVYDEAKDQDQTAGMVSSVNTPDILKRRGMELFQVSINMAARKRGVFSLIYQQLLRRKLGTYTHVVNIDTPTVVEDLEVHVAVYEPQGFTYFSVEEPGSNSVVPQDTNIVVDGEHVRSAVYRPSVERQNGIKNSRGGLSGEFLINYDVNHNEDAGLVFTDEGYFVHYFSPNGLQPLSKNVVFVIDVSGSMSGSKITHTRAALLTILETLRPFDQFEMVLFDDEIMFWHRNGRLVLADDENINQAKRHISAHLNADGSTNINDALVAGCRLLQDVGQKGQNIIFFLTDGLPNVGVVNSNRIAANVKRAAGEKTSVFSLGFGADLDFDLLKKISYETGGWAEAIYTGDDSGQQLENVYQQVNTPLLYDIRMIYEESAVDINTVTKRDFHTYFNGSELVVAGRLQDTLTENWVVEIVTSNGDEDRTFTKDVGISDISIPEEAQQFYPEGFTEKLWATERIRYLLDERMILEGEEKDRVYREALDMALRYKLVTPITSMVVTKDVNDGESVGLQQNEVGMVHSDSGRILYASVGRGGVPAMVADAVVICVALIWVSLH